MRTSCAAGHNCSNCFRKSSASSVDKNVAISKGHLRVRCVTYVGVVSKCICPIWWSYGWNPPFIAVHRMALIPQVVPQFCSKQGRRTQQRWSKRKARMHPMPWGLRKGLIIDPFLLADPDLPRHLALSKSQDNTPMKKPPTHIFSWHCLVDNGGICPNLIGW